MGTQWQESLDSKASPSGIAEVSRGPFGLQDSPVLGCGVLNAYTEPRRGLLEKLTPTEGYLAFRIVQKVHLKLVDLFPKTKVTKESYSAMT